MASATISLRTSDNVLIKTNFETIRRSLKIMSMLEDADKDKDGNITIYLGEVNSVILEKVLEWTSFHQDDEPNKVTDVQTEWDKQYLEVDAGTLFEIVLAAEYLDIGGLLNISAQKVVSMIRGETVEKIRENFGIRNDFTKEEEDLIRKENEWCDTN